MLNDVEVAREVGEDLVRFETSDSGHYTLLANVFASHGMWHETANVRKIMRASKTKKAPGFSQIEVSMRNHVFYSRDQEHPQCAEIYEMLNDTIIPQMKGSPCTGFWEGPQMNHFGNVVAAILASNDRWRRRLYYIISRRRYHVHKESTLAALFLNGNRKEEKSFFSLPLGGRSRFHFLTRSFFLICCRIPFPFLVYKFRLSLCPPIPFAPMAAAAHEPEVIRDKAAMRAWSRRRRTEGKAVALVPTMGFLHDGHLSLVSAAVAAAAGPVAVVVSIYVNPSQFAPTEDLATYPSDFAGDLRKLSATGAVAAVFCPPDLYVRGSAGHPTASASGGAASCLEEAGGHAHETWIRVEQLEKGLCGSAGAAGPCSSAAWPPWSPSCSISSSRTSLCSGRRIINSGASSAGW
ncbi:hypothetical protein PVAP13_9KG018000 [Panicum virgatum]|nr:hypothetical protein PVAP13_9KG018000 [Panicum virgatum]KAG2544452.1 hypothetical protein PVAP13_9KG018000 [Panicum virgatum]KAG2544453.1 hypothetical protein PVAP13_9KG018000 [Panicum virgatum]